MKGIDSMSVGAVLVAAGAKFVHHGTVVELVVMMTTMKVAGDDIDLCLIQGYNLCTRLSIHNIELLIGQ